MSETSPLPAELTTLFHRPRGLPKEMDRFRATFDVNGYAVIRGPSPMLRWPDVHVAANEAVSFRAELSKLSTNAVTWLEQATVAGRRAPPDTNPDAKGMGLSVTTPGGRMPAGAGRESASCRQGPMPIR